MVWLNDALNFPYSSPKKDKDPELWEFLYYRFPNIFTPYIKRHCPKNILENLENAPERVYITPKKELTPDMLKSIEDINKMPSPSNVKLADWAEIFYKIPPDSRNKAFATFRRNWLNFGISKPNQHEID